MPQTTQLPPPHKDQMGCPLPDSHCDPPTDIKWVDP